MKTAKTKLVIYGLLLLYGVALVAVSFYVFNPTKKTISPPVQKVVQSLAGLSVTSDGSIVFTPPKDKVSVIQLSLVLPYKDSLKNIKGSFVMSGMNPFYNKTVVDKTNNKITVDLAAYSLEGVLITVPTVIAKLDLAGNQSGLTFNQAQTKIMTLGSDTVVSISYTDK